MIALAAALLVLLPLGLAFLVWRRVSVLGRVSRRLTIVMVVGGALSALFAAYVERVLLAFTGLTFDVATSGYGGAIEILHEPDLPQASWRFGEGVVHHVAYDVGDADTQQRAKDWLEGLGYTDCSERKDRQYFYSVYMRSPGGALIELAYSRPEGFEIDEPYDKLGSDFMLPPQFEHRRDEILARLEPIDRG